MVCYIGAVLRKFLGFLKGYKVVSLAVAAATMMTGQ